MTNVQVSSSQVDKGIIWRGEEKRRRKRRNIFKEGFFCSGEDRGRSKEICFFLEIFLIKGGGSRFPKRQKMFFCQKKKTTRKFSSVSRGGHRFRKVPQKNVFLLLPYIGRKKLVYPSRLWVAKGKNFGRLFQTNPQIYDVGNKTCPNKTRSSRIKQPF